ncbi:MAG: hypothetical protein IPM38_13985 [Ignavibacteria bacterium]|nr:hypothetical protein [Ignavibacteria bacterium]
MKISFIILFVTLFSVTEINAQSQWMQTPGIPEGGGVTDMVIADNGNIVVTTASFNWPNGQDGGVRWSSNEGATWNAPFNFLMHEL